MQTEEFYSHGKLLLTGEYVVLDGAKALAFPSKFGQSLIVNDSNSENYTWTSLLRNGEIWQKVIFSLEDILQNKGQTDFEKRLFQILKVVYQSHSKLFNNFYDFTTKLDFEKNWGLGSSSTLINNIAQWANINAYKLLDKTFGGSGYDIAAASMSSPFYYQKVSGKLKTKTVSISNTLKPNLFFVYLNQKQNSRDAIENYRKINKADNIKVIKKINNITESIPDTQDLNVFESLLAEHEDIISKLLKIRPVQKEKFKDYNNGIVKSLGAWGGDFVMVTAGDKSELEYFRKKGYNTIFEYDEIIL